MCRALLAHPQEALHKQHLVYYMLIMSVGCTSVGCTTANWLYFLFSLFFSFSLFFLLLFKKTKPASNNHFLLTTVHTYDCKTAAAAHYKKDDSLNCRTIISDISGYHADFHEGHGTVGAWQRRSMTYVK
jgi:hypothetical protein